MTVPPSLRALAGLLQPLAPLALPLALQPLAVLAHRWMTLPDPPPPPAVSCAAPAGGD